MHILLADIYAFRNEKMKFSIFSFFLPVGFLKIYFIYLFLAALGLRCCVRAFSSCRERGLLFAVVCGLLIAVASLVASTGPRCVGFSSCGTRALERRLSSCGARA